MLEIVIVAGLAALGYLIVHNIMTPSRPKAPKAEAWHAILGVHPDAARSTIDAAHAALRARYEDAGGPDLPADLRALAEARLATIDEAYRASFRRPN